MGFHYAHSAPVGGKKQELKVHLLSVASKAADFAAKFDSQALGYLSGLWHDMGKYDPAFQKYLDDPEHRRGPRHKLTGAVHAGRANTPLTSYVILGHHGGLPCRSDVRQIGVAPPDIKALVKAFDEDMGADAGIPPSPAPPAWIDCPHSLELFIRMLFSALVDADALDTEAHFHPLRAPVRGQGPPLSDVWQRLEGDQAALSGRLDDRVNRARHEVYMACLKAAEQSPGFFRLTVPTGGGKTRSGLAFGLRHALLHGLDRVIIAAPYTAIIEQTAQTLRDAVGAEAVLEHHSAAEIEDEDEGEDGARWARLAAQNWDAPVIITTTVQLFESLFHNRPGRCRKLHNIARSVIILDEVQTLPPELLTPVTNVLGELVRHYRTTVLLCTATQPAWGAWSKLSGLSEIREAVEVVPDSPRLFRELERVAYRVIDQPVDWAAAAAMLREQRQGLAVLNTRAHALGLLDALDDPDALHLSTLLCAAHRRVVLARAKDKLSDDEPCHLVSTQTIEAGVDIDFPFVMRAMGPLDRIVQAAGRCNREGRLECGVCVVFTPQEKGMPRGAYRVATDVAVNAMKSGSFDPNDPQTFDRYFARWLGHVETDTLNIQRLREAMDYPEVALKFKLIRDESNVPAVVHYRDPERDPDLVLDLIRRLRAQSERPSVLFRGLQPFIVSVPRSKLSDYQKGGLIVPLVPGLWEWLGTYDERRGIGTGTADFAGYVF